MFFLFSCGFFHMMEKKIFFAYMTLILILLIYCLFNVEFDHFLIVRCSTIGECVRAFSQWSKASLKFNLAFKLKLLLTM